jgi:hypothetical protein
MMKKNLAITSAVAAVLVLGGCGQAAQNDWDDDDARYCVDNDGDVLPASACSNGGGGAFVWMSHSKYSKRYPSKYKSFTKSSAYKSSSYAKPSTSGGVSRGMAGGSARGFSVGG